MLKTTPQAIFEEIEAGERNRKAVCQHKKKMVDSYSGPYFGSNRAQDEESPENFHYEYTSYLLPRLVYNNPRTHVKSRRLGPQRIVAKAIEHGLNRWCVDTDFRRTLVPAAMDYLFLHTVLLVTQEEDEKSLHPATRQEMGNKVPYLPKVTHLDTDDFVWDPVGRSPMDWRWAGHYFTRDKEDLIAEAEEPESDWDLKAVKDLAEDCDKALKDRASFGVNAPERGEIRLVEIWYPEWFDESKYESAEEASDDGYHGGIFTVAMDQMHSSRRSLREGFIRKPRGFYGPRWGPYAYIGAYPVPGEANRLSPLMAVEALNRNVNKHARAVRDSASSYKRLLIVNGDDKRIAQKVKSGKHLSVLDIQGFTKDQVGEYSYGGADQTQIAALAMFKDQLDRNAGLGEAQRGATTSGATATETAVAANSSALRMDFVLQQWTDGVVKALRTVAWYLYHDDRVVFPLGEEAHKDLGVDEADTIIFEGGDFDEDSGATFDDLELDIEPYSMERTDQGLLQRRIVDFLGLLPNLIQMVGMAPTGVEWPELFDRIGDAFNMPGLGGMIHPEEIAAAVGAQAEAGGSEGPMLGKMAGGSTGRPKPARGGSGGATGLPAATGATGMLAGAAASQGGF